jgi:hypothetical protein
MIEIQLTEPENANGVFYLWYKCPNCGLMEKTFYNPLFPDAWYNNRCRICEGIIPNVKALVSFNAVRLSYHRDSLLKLNADREQASLILGNNVMPISRGAL